MCEVLDQLARQGRLRVPVVTDQNAMAVDLDAVETEFGGLDVVVNTAGVTLLSPITPLDLADRDRINNLAKATPLERLDRAEDIVEAAAFLAAQLGRGGDPCGTSAGGMPSYVPSPDRWSAAPWHAHGPWLDAAGMRGQRLSNPLDRGAPVRQSCT